MALYGTRDLALANPPESLPESTPCEDCGHTMEDHWTAKTDHDIGCMFEVDSRLNGAGVQESVFCPCETFREPAEREELDGLALSQAVDRERGI